MSARTRHFVIIVGLVMMVCAFATSTVLFSLSMDASILTTRLFGFLGTILLFVALVDWLMSRAAAALRIGSRERLKPFLTGGALLVLVVLLCAYVDPGPLKSFDQAQRSIGGQTCVSFSRSDWLAHSYTIQLCGKRVVNRAHKVKVALTRVFCTPKEIGWNCGQRWVFHEPAHFNCPSINGATACTGDMLVATQMVTRSYAPGRDYSIATIMLPIWATASGGLRTRTEESLHAGSL